MYCSGQNVINVAAGVYGTKRESSGLSLSATSTFKPIGALSTRIHVTAPAALFVHYQVTSYGFYDFWTKLIVNYFNAGSLVHSGVEQYHKVATGYWVANVEPGYYDFEIHYKSSASFSLTAGSDWQTSVINLMWFDGMHTASDGVKCYPKPNINKFNILSPVQNLEALLHTPWSTVILAAYQTSIYTSSSGNMMARMEVNDQQLKSTTMINQGSYIELNGLWMKYLRDGDYHFGLSYRNAYDSFFEDCRNAYMDNKNLYAMTLPSGKCSIVANVEPTSSLYLSPSSWRNTDLSYKFTLSQTSHVIVRYQFSGPANSNYVITRLAINNVPQPHTASIRGNKGYSGNSGFWQGVLSGGTSYTFTVQHSAGTTYYHYVAGPSYEQYTRAMDIVQCS